VLAFKDTVLSARGAEARCERTTVPADLREDWTTALTGAGFNTTRRAAWLAKGLLLYLTADEASQLLTGVSELSAPAASSRSSTAPWPPPR
jgi:methyltransferase (TIGR00027 family)